MLGGGRVLRPVSELSTEETPTSTPGVDSAETIAPSPPAPRRTPPASPETQGNTLPPTSSNESVRTHAHTHGHENRDKRTPLITFPQVRGVYKWSLGESNP